VSWARHVPNGGRRQALAAGNCDCFGLATPCGQDHLIIADACDSNPKDLRANLHPRDLAT
jgi:hypothetical protein